MDFYTGSGKADPGRAAKLPPSGRYGHMQPVGYLPDDGLKDAVNVALTLGQPLLLTGEAGTGKTQLAYSVAWELGLEPVLKFETKSSSTAKDLFYTFDTVGRFHAAQTGGSKDNLDYITYNSLGSAILLANKEQDVQKWLPKDFKHDGPKRTVVLIDEVDKAPRDFPNDILNEIEEMYFKIPELGNAQVSADRKMSPILMLTSNSEKHLPDAFLRRCIYYNIPFPDQEKLRDICIARIGDSPFLSDALEFFFTLRDSGSRLRKKPATAELLGWLLVLTELADGVENPLRQKKADVQQTLSTLVKTADDQDQAKAVHDDWSENHS